VTEKQPGRRERKVANREGRIYQRKSDGRFVGVVWPPDQAGGKPRYVYGKTREDALEKRDQLKNDLAAGLPVGRDMTLADFYRKKWYRMLEQEVRAGDLAHSTLDSYRDNAEMHILPDIGAIRLRDLSPSRVREWRTDLMRKPARRQRKRLRPGEAKLPPPVLLSPRTVAYCYAILRRSLEDAIGDELVARNVAVVARKKKAGKSPAGQKKKRQAALPKADARKLLEVASGDRLWCYWLVVLSLGLRRGEALAIRWDDIDFEQRTIRLEATVQRITITDPDTGERSTKLVRKAMKTAASEDAGIPAGTGLLEALRRHQRQQAGERLRSSAWKDHGLVFTTTIGTALEPRNVSRSWEAICAAAGVKVRIHDLRHACGDYLVAAGIHQRVVQGVLRHARLSTTEIYMDVLEEVRRDAIDAMDSVVFSDLAPCEKPALRSVKH
jgi:integrase